jgi:hypothetical protein
MASPELSSTPVRNMAARDDGLDRRDRQPSAQGQVMMRTEIAVTMASCQVAPCRPAQHGQKRRRVHDGGIEPRRAVGELHVAGARLHGIVEQPADLRQQRAFGRRRHPHPQRARQVERAGVDGRARPRLHG